MGLTIAQEFALLRERSLRAKRRQRLWMAAILALGFGLAVLVRWWLDA